MGGGAVPRDNEETMGIRELQTSHLDHLKPLPQWQQTFFYYAFHDARKTLIIEQATLFQSLLKLSVVKIYT